MGDLGLVVGVQAWQGINDKIKSIGMAASESPAELFGVDRPFLSDSNAIQAGDSLGLRSNLS